VRAGAGRRAGRLGRALGVDHGVALAASAALGLVVAIGAIGVAIDLGVAARPALVLVAAAIAAATTALTAGLVVAGFRGRSRGRRRYRGGGLGRDARRLLLGPGLPELAGVRGDLGLAIALRLAIGVTLAVIRAIEDRARDVVDAGRRLHGLDDRRRLGADRD